MLALLTLLTLLALLSLLTLLALLALLTLLALLALLTLLTLLTLLALLALLSLLTLLTLLTLLALLITAQLILLALGHVFQLALQLFGFAAQHLLLPTLLRGLLLAFFLLLGEFLLPLGKLLELLQRFVDLLLLLLLLAGGLRLVALVLILFGIQFEIEKAFHVARASATTTAAAPALVAEGHLDIARCCFGAHQVLQRPLFGRQRVLPFGALQLVGGGPHGLHRGFHILHKALEGVACFGQLAGLHAVGQRLGLIAEFALHAGQERGVFGIAALGSARPSTDSRWPR